MVKTQKTLRKRLTYLLFTSKIIVIFWLIFIQITGSLQVQQLIDSIGIIAPLFTAHIALIIKYYLDQKSLSAEGLEMLKKDDEKEISSTLWKISNYIPIVYVVFLMSIIFLKATGDIGEFSQFKNLLVMGETLFGAYLGSIIASFFK